MTFKELIRPGVRGVIAASMTAASIAFVLMGTTIPEAWWPLHGMALAFYFSVKSNGN